MTLSRHHKPWAENITKHRALCCDSAIQVQHALTTPIRVRAVVTPAACPCMAPGISPADVNRDHTLSTLRYASRAMAIKNSLHRSVMSPTEELAYLKELVSQLQAENSQLKQVMADAGLTLAGGSAVGATPQKVPVPGRVESVCDMYVKAC